MAVYKVERSLADGQRVQVGTYRDAGEARRIIEGLREYWPGEYQIVQTWSQMPQRERQSSRS